MTGFIPDGYVDHLAAWRAAYYSLYGPLNSDDELREYVEKVCESWDETNRKRARELKPKPSPESRVGDPIARRPHEEQEGPVSKGLPPPLKVARPKLEGCDVASMLLVARVGESIFNPPPIPADRIGATRNLLIQALYDGSIFAYCTVHLSLAARQQLESLGIALPDPIEPVKDPSLWLTQSGADAISEGRLLWGHSTYDPATVRPIYFSKFEIGSTFSATTPKAQSAHSKGKSRKLRDAVKAQTLAVRPNGISPENGAVKAARNEVSKALGIDVKEGLFRVVLRELSASEWQ